jgi:hypothetical protein
MINKVLLMRKEHLAKLNRERVHRYRQRKREADTSEYMRRVQEQKQQYLEARRLNHVNLGFFKLNKINLVLSF